MAASAAMVVIVGIKPALNKRQITLPRERREYLTAVPDFNQG